MLTARIRDPIWWTDLIQLAKTVLAAVVAWVIAAILLDLPQPFLAPWSALLVVHATVYRTFSRGMQQVAATVTAVLLAAAVGQLLGLNTAALAVLLVVALLIGRMRWYGAESVTVATTAMIVLTTGFHDDTLLISRLLDTGIGIGVGLVVNLLVWPPLRRRTAETTMERLDADLGQLLCDISEGVTHGCAPEEIDDWGERTRHILADIGRAWANVRQVQESARLNPRRSARLVRDPSRWRATLRRLEQAAAETHSLLRTLGTQEDHRRIWGDAFAEPWLAMLRDAGLAALSADPRAHLEVRSRLVDFTEELRTTDRSSEWPVYGALIINLRNIIDAMDVVAETKYAGRAPLPTEPT